MQQVREELICAVCLEFLREPKVLLCAHSFCQVCLREILSKANRGARDARNRAVDLECPSCRHITTLEHGRVEIDLRTNFNLKRLVEIVSDGEKRHTLKVRTVVAVGPPPTPCIMCVCVGTCVCASLRSCVRGILKMFLPAPLRLYAVCLKAVGLRVVATRYCKRLVTTVLCTFYNSIDSIDTCIYILSMIIVPDRLVSYLPLRNSILDRCKASMGQALKNSTIERMALKTFIV